MAFHMNKDQRLMLVPFDGDGRGEIRPGDIWMEILSDGAKFTPTIIDHPETWPICFGKQLLLRPVQVDEWIEYAKEKPVAGDFPISTFGRHGKVGFAAEADEKVHNGAPRTHGCWVSSIEDEQITHWRRVTPPPVAVEQPIMIESHKVQFLDDGSLVVGCTTVTSDKFKEITQRREQKMKGTK